MFLHEQVLTDGTSNKACPVLCDTSAEFELHSPNSTVPESVLDISDPAQLLTLIQSGEIFCSPLTHNNGADVGSTLSKDT